MLPCGTSEPGAMVQVDDLSQRVADRSGGPQSRAAADVQAWLVDPRVCPVPLEWDSPAKQRASSRLSEPGKRGIHQLPNAFRRQFEVEHRFDELELHHRQTAVDPHQIESRVE
jgi:hypothetical protein